MSESTATPTPAVQDYLRVIYEMTAAEPAGGYVADRVATSRLAERLDVRPASVTAMLQKMAAADPALVEYHKSRGARLTAAGEAAAREVVRCHRLLETYLHEVFGYGRDEAHDEADRLEHGVGAAMTERIAAALGHPTHTPDGDPIPEMKETWMNTDNTD